MSIRGLLEGWSGEWQGCGACMAALRDGRKVMVNALPGYSESAQGWSGVLQDIKRAG